jgi:serine protease
VASLTARISVDTAAPTAGSPVQFSSGTSTTGAGRTLTGWAWTVVNAGGIASTFTGATNGPVASITPSAAGSFTVRLTLTDDLGITATSDQVVAVAAAPVPVPPVTPVTPTSPVAETSGGGGGGAMSWPWLVLLCLAVWALAHRPFSAADRA